MIKNDVEQVELNHLLYVALKSTNVKCIKLLLEQRADPSAIYNNNSFYQSSPEGYSSLYFVQNLNIEESKKNEISKLLLEYRAYAMVDFPGNNDFSPLMPAVKHENYEMIKLLLDNGISNITFGENFNDKTPYELVESGVYFKNHTKRVEILELLNDDVSAPYINIQDTKYIIHEYDTKLDIEVLGVLKQNKTNTKYLYSEERIAIILYWVITRGYYYVDVLKVIKRFKAHDILVSKSSLLNFIQDVISDNYISVKLLQMEFRDNNFIQDYLSLTLWKYNFHDDLKLLFSTENAFPFLKNNKKTYEYILKLIDLRYNQYLRDWSFTINSNQNKAELQALIEGKEPPKREIDLSWLEEHCGEDDLSDVDTKVTDNKTKKAHKKGNNIIPDDFFLKE